MESSGGSNTGLAARLCDQCRDEDLEGFIRGDHGEDGKLYVQKRYKLQKDCVLCVQFATIAKQMAVENEQSDCLDEGDVFKVPRLLSIDVIRRPYGTSISIATRKIVSLDQVESYIGSIDKNVFTSPSGATPFNQHNTSKKDIRKLPQVQYGRIKGWLRLCEDHHTNFYCGPRTKKALEVITVIDCHQRQLRNIQSHEPYIALSYLWGEISQSLLNHGDQLPQNLPRTIADAMIVAIALNIPYLWIDRYCIDQRNLDERKRIIRHMDQIYCGAYLTIIAAAGDGPEYGLPGVSSTPRQSLERIDVGEYMFINRGKMYCQISRSVWSTRGWTYQEALLSRRCLCFTESEVYFQCSDMVCYESIVSPLSEPEERQLFPRGYLGDSPLTIYKRIEEFWIRKLSFRGERLDAMQGVFGAFQRMNTSHINSPFFKTHFWGIPVFLDTHNPQNSGHKSFKSGLLFAYCWEAAGDFNDAFPSWSWAGREPPHFINGQSLRFAEARGPSSAITKWSTPLIRATKTDGTEVEVGEFTQLSSNYKDFRTHIDITSWSIWTFIANGNNLVCRDLVWQDVEDATLDRYRDYDTLRVLVVYIQAHVWSRMPELWSPHLFRPLKELVIDNKGNEAGTLPRVGIYCLLLEETAPGAFRRIGIWRVPIRVHWESMSVDELFTKHLTPNVAGADEKWENRTVRVW